VRLSLISLVSGSAWLRFQGRLAVRGAVLGDRRIERRQILLGFHSDLGQVVLVLVGVGLQVGRVGVEHRPRHQLVAHRQFHDLVEDLLIDRALGETPPPVLAQRRGVRNLVPQLQPQEPAVSHVHLHLAHQLPLRPNTIQIPQQQQLEQNHRLKRRTAVVLAVKMLHPRPDETEIDALIDLPQQVIPVDERLQVDSDNRPRIEDMQSLHVRLPTQNNGGTG